MITVLDYSPGGSYVKKSKDVLGVSMRSLYAAGQESKAKQAVRRILDEFCRHSIPEQELMLGRIRQLIGRGTFAAGRVDELRARNRLLSIAIAEHVVQLGRPELVAKHFWSVSQLLNVPSIEELYERMAQMTMQSGYFRYVGASVQSALTFCRTLYGMMAKGEEQHGHLDPATFEQIATGKEHRPFSMVFMSLSCPVDDQCPQKLWFIRLLEAASETRYTEVEQYLEASFELVGSVVRFGFSRSPIQGGVVILPQRTLEADQHESGASQLELMKNDVTNPRIVVPDHLYEKTVGLSNALHARNEQACASAEAFRSWFLDHSNVIGTVFDERCREIVEKPKYGLRPMGHDSCLVRISALRSVGITSFSFYPEGEHFPDVKLSIAVRKSAGPMLCQYMVALRNFQLQARDIVFENWNDIEVGYLRSVMEFVVVDALHRIVVRKPTKDLADEQVERVRTVPSIEPRRRVTVRPFLRRLPVGFQASEESQQLAFLHLGWVLPEGVTFVQSHDRWMGLPSGKPTPLFEYTDEFLMQSILEDYRRHQEQRANER